MVAIKASVMYGMGCYQGLTRTDVTKAPKRPLRCKRNLIDGFSVRRLRRGVTCSLYCIKCTENRKCRWSSWMRQTLNFYHGTWVHKYNGKLGLSAIKHGPWEILSRVVMVAGECGWISRTAHVREKPCRRYLTQLPIKAIPVPNASRRRHVGVKCLRNRNWNRLQLHHKIHYMSSRLTGSHLDARYGEERSCQVLFSTLQSSMFCNCCC